MATESPSLDQYRLETRFCTDHVIHTTYESESESESATEESGAKAGIETRWTLGDKIGSGGFGVVLRQEDEKGQLRAVKKLSRDMLAANRVDFSRELSTFVKLKKHPKSFVEFLGWYDNEDFVFLTMEYIQYGDLSMYLKDFGAKAKQQAKEITRQLLEGLVVMHGQNICHRDLKPQNVLIAGISPIWVKITDFGLSKSEQNTNLRTNCGTTNYKAPELQGLLPRRPRRRGDKPMAYTNAVDLWSLGALVHEILTLEIPFLETFLDDDPSETGVEPPSDNTLDWVDLPDMELMRDYCNGKAEFPTGSLEKSRVSRSGIEFVKKLLAPEPQSRMTAADALKSLWITMGPCNDRLTKFIEENPLLKEFFPRALHESYVERAAKMITMLQDIGCPKDIAMDLIILTLYDLIVVINDNPSMKLEDDSHMRDLGKFLSSVAEIYTFARPNGIVAAEFANLKLPQDDVTKENLQDFIVQSPYVGNKSLEMAICDTVVIPYLIRGSLEKPTLAITSTVAGLQDGASALGTYISFVKRDFPHRKPFNAAAFQICQLGNDEIPEDILPRFLDHSPQGGYVDFLSVSPHLDKPKTSEEYWVFMAKVLLGAILPEWNKRRLEVPSNSDTNPGVTSVLRVPTPRLPDQAEV